MHTLETETLRRELLRDILDIDNPELLKKLKRSFNRIRTNYMPQVVKEDLTPYTMEELNARIDEFEAELEAGEWLEEEEANAKTREALPWLK